MKSPKRFVSLNQKRRKVTPWFAGFMSLILTLGLFTPTYQAEAHNAYMLSIVPDFESGIYQALVVENNSANESDHLEFKIIDSYNYLLQNKSSVPGTTEGFKATIIDKNKNTFCVFTFPSCGTEEGYLKNITSAIANIGSSIVAGAAGLLGIEKDDGQLHATETDRLAANEVGRVLVSQLNQVLSYIKRETVDSSGNPWIYATQESDDKIDAFFEMTSKFANAAYQADSTNGSGSFTFKGTTFKVTEISPNGSDATNKRMTIEVTSKEGSGKIPSAQEFRYSAPKYTGLSKASQELQSGKIKNLNLRYIVAFGNGSYANEGIRSDALENVYNPGWLERAVVLILNGALSFIRNVLGMDTTGELIFNAGARDTATWYGIAPEIWFEGASIIFWISQIFAWLLLVGALLKFIGSHLWGTITPYQRVTLMRGIQDLIITAIGLTIIAPIFELFVYFNYLIVDILEDLTIFNHLSVTGSAYSFTLGGVILSIIFFAAEVVINFIYLLRGVTICILFGLSPVFVVAYAFGGKAQGITLNFIKEVIGNIYVQTFHAVILCFYCYFMYTGAAGGFLEQLVMVYSFMPLTKLFKTITGIGESDFIQRTAENARGGLKSTTIGNKATPLERLENKGGVVGASQAATVKTAQTIKKFGELGVNSATYSLSKYYSGNK